MQQTQIIVMAGGKGKRMGQIDVPKALVKLNGKPIIEYVVDAIKKSCVTENPIIVIGHKGEMIEKALGPKYEYVIQAEQLGTGHAVACAKEKAQGKFKNILVLNGDHPLISGDTIAKLAKHHEETGAIVTLGTATVVDYNDWRQTLNDYGRVLRDENGVIVGVIEKRDATPEQLEVKEVNINYFCYNAEWLWAHLDKLKNNNAQGEYYLTDLIGMAFEEGITIESVSVDPKEALGVNSIEQLELISSL